MKQLFFYVVIFCLFIQITVAQIKLPQPSPKATVSQTVGTTDFIISYSRPSLRGRDVFGTQTTIAPLGQLWRTGANTATTFHATTDLTVEGQRLPANTYSILTIPTQNEWTLIFNKNVNATTDQYKQEEDALRIKLKSTSSPELVQTFTIHFSDLTDSTAKLNFSWGNVTVVANLQVDVKANAKANVLKAVAEKPEDSGFLLQAANWNLSTSQNLDQGLAWVDKSIGLKETFRNVWIKSQILAKMGKITQALPLAQKALSLGQSSTDPAFSFLKDAIQKSITDYQAMLPPPAQVSKGKKKKT